MAHYLLRVAKKLLKSLLFAFTQVIRARLLRGRRSEEEEDVFAVKRHYRRRRRLW